MEFNQLHCFKVVAEMEHLTRAAEHLHISQPSLSRTISRLEEDIGTPLFDRIGNKIFINRYGQAFLKRVEIIFQQLEEGCKELREMSGKERGHIYFSTNLTEFPSALVKNFLLDNPSVSIQQWLQPKSEIINCLQNGRIDFAIMTKPDKIEGLMWTDLMEDEIFLHVSADHPLAKREAVDLKELRDFSFVTKGLGFSNSISNFFQSEGINPKIIYEGNDPKMMGQLVVEGDALSFISSIDYHELYEEYQEVPRMKSIHLSSPRCVRELGIAQMSNHFLSEAAQDFLKEATCFFEAYKQRVSEILPKKK